MSTFIHPVTELPTAPGEKQIIHFDPFSIPITVARGERHQDSRLHFIVAPYSVIPAFGRDSFTERDTMFLGYHEVHPCPRAIPLLSSPYLFRSLSVSSPFKLSGQSLEIRQWLAAEYGRGGITTGVQSRPLPDPPLREGEGVVTEGNGNDGALQEWEISLLECQ